MTDTVALVTADGGDVVTIDTDDDVGVSRSSVENNVTRRRAVSARLELVLGDEGVLQRVDARNAPASVRRVAQRVASLTHDPTDEVCAPCLAHTFGVEGAGVLLVELVVCDFQNTVADIVGGGHRCQFIVHRGECVCVRLSRAVHCCGSSPSQEGNDC